jgi:PAS domain S-box-containing protein
MSKELFKRYPALAFVLIWAGCTLCGVLAPKGLSVLDFVEKWLADLRLSTIGSTMAPRSNIVLFTITEDTLAQHPYRFPLDRGMLADAIERFNKAGVKVIGLDILFDQSTEPEKDRELARSIADSAAPVVVGWASAADGLTKKQIAYLDSYLPEAIHAPSNLTKDAGDGTVRWLYPGLETENGYRVAFAPALARAAGVETSKDTKNLFYRRGHDGNTAPFRTFPLHILKDLPQSWYADKIVLIGADLPNEDRHRTPFASLLGDDAGSLPGVVIHAHALAQLFDGVTFSHGGIIFAILIVAFASAIAIGIALIDASMPIKLLFCGVFLLMFWGAGFALFATVDVLIPLFAPTLTFGIAASLSAAVMAQRYKQKKQFAEAMVQRRNQTLHKVVENSFDGIVVTTSDGTIITTNSSADALMGWKNDEIIGTRITDYVPGAEEYGSHFLDLDGTQRREAGPAIQPLEVECQRADGTPFTMEILVYTARVSFALDDVSTNGGERVSYIYSFRDVTVRKLAEEAREKALQEAQAANKAKTEFLANMSHELRTPLNAIIGFSELMKTQALGPLGVDQYVEYMEDIHNSGNHLIEIVNDILDMSKIEAGELKPNEEIFDFSGVADVALRMVADRAQKGDVKLNNKLSGSSMRIHADQRMMKQILLNLLSNAVKFTPSDGEVTIEASADHTGLTISVTDTGCGIPADKMDVVLEPFGQADMTLGRVFEGTGLGLPLVKAMAELHGGSLDIRSIVDEGTTATIWLSAERVVREQEIA